jgi:hypothetical protein
MSVIGMAAWDLADDTVPPRGASGRYDTGPIKVVRMLGRPPAVSMEIRESLSGRRPQRVRTHPGGILTDSGRGPRHSNSTRHRYVGPC